LNLRRIGQEIVKGGIEMANIDELAVEKMLGKLTALRAEATAAEQAALDAMIGRSSGDEVSLHSIDPGAADQAAQVEFRVGFDEAAAEYRLISP
jgi:hypothetical protein